MPKRTDAEWQALDQRIACEIMGLLTWDDLTPAERQDYIDVVPKKFLDMSLERWKKNYWKRQYESVFPLHAFSGWQPHLDVEQAFRVLDAIVALGFDAGVKTRHYDSLHEVWIVPAECRAPCWLGVHDERRKAICLSVEQWANAQKEEQHAQED